MNTSKNLLLSLVAGASTATEATTLETEAISNWGNVRPLKAERVSVK